MTNDKWSGNNPWLGLAPYTEGTPLYGRTQESAILSEIIKDNIATIVYGKSGIGKSSLLSAGISPMLRSEQYIPVPLRLVHNTEVSYVEQIENRVRELVECKDELPENVPDLGLWDFFHRHTFTKDGVSCRPVIILDQFEEIYTLTDAKHKPAIIALFTELASLLNDIKPYAVLAAESSFTEATATSSSSDDDFSFELSTGTSFAYDETVSFRFVICLREDKLYLLERNSANIPSIKTNRYNLQALSPDSALEVITFPRPDLFTNEEATAIVDKLADMGDEGIQTVDPAILSLFLYKYYEKKGEANYDNIFADYYHEATKDIKEKSIAFLEDHLLTLGGYRNQIPIEDARSSGVLLTEIDILLKKIVLRSEKRNGIDYIEFSHDRLCDEAKKNRDSRNTDIKKKARLLRLSILAICFLVLVALGLFVWYHIQIAQKNKEQEEHINIIELLRDSLYRENEHKTIIADSLKDALLNNKAYAESISTQNIRIALQNLSLNKANSLERAQNLMIKNLAKDLKNKYDSLQNYIAMNSMIVKIMDVTKACLALRDAAGSGNLLQLYEANEKLKSFEVSYFADLKCLTSQVPSFIGHFIFDTDYVDEILRKGNLENFAKNYPRRNILRGAVENFVYTINSMVAASDSTNFSYSTRGYQEIAVVTEPTGLIDVIVRNKTTQQNIYANENNGKGNYYSQVSLYLPYDKNSDLELVIINKTQKDHSFVIITSD